MPIDFTRARLLLIYEGDGEPIASAEILPPPKLALNPVEYTRDDDAIVRWTVTDDGDLRFLVQWQDERGVWRGVAPRQVERELVIPRRLRRARRQLPIRVLASNGLATAMATVLIEPLRKRVDPDKDPPIRIAATSGEAAVVRAWAIDYLGRTLPGAGIAWFDGDGTEIARGSNLDTRLVASGRRLVRVVALDAGAGKAERDIEVIGRQPRGPGHRPPRAKPDRCR